MRDEFIIVSDKNNGYPSFENAVEFEEIKGKGLYKIGFISYNGKYPEYLNKKFEDDILKYYSELSFFVFKEINDGYPTYIKFDGLKVKIVSDIYNQNNKAICLYFNELPVKKVYFQEKLVYHFGYEN